MSVVEGEYRRRVRELEQALQAERSHTLDLRQRIGRLEAQLDSHQPASKPDTLSSAESNAPPASSSGEFVLLWSSAGKLPAKLDCANGTIQLSTNIASLACSELVHMRELSQNDNRMDRLEPWRERVSGVFTDNSDLCAGSAVRNSRGWSTDACNQDELHLWELIWRDSSSSEFRCMLIEMNVSGAARLRNEVKKHFHGSLALPVRPSESKPCPRHCNRSDAGSSSSTQSAPGGVNNADHDSQHAASSDPALASQVSAPQSSANDMGLNNHRRFSRGDVCRVIPPEPEGAEPPPSSSYPARQCGPSLQMAKQQQQLHFPYHDLHESTSCANTTEVAASCEDVPSVADAEDHRLAQVNTRETLEPGPRTPPVSEQSGLLTSKQLAALAARLPSRFRRRKFELIYSTMRDGISLKTFYRKARNWNCSALVVQDTRYYMFGTFASEPWRPSEKYEGTGESFVFQLSPCMYAWRWSERNSHFMYGTNSEIAVGGFHFVINLDEEFLWGSSMSCDTFNSPCIASSEEFKVLHVELWGFS
jgi:hypothetical protein